MARSGSRRSHRASVPLRSAMTMVEGKEEEGQVSQGGRYFHDLDRPAPTRISSRKNHAAPP